MNNKRKIKSKTAHLQKLRTELIMRDRNNGWYNEWLRITISNLEDEINKLQYKHTFK